MEIHMEKTLGNPAYTSKLVRKSLKLKKKKNSSRAFEQGSLTN